MRKDPRVAYLDPHIFAKLSATLWYELSEIDELRQALLDTYSAFLREVAASASPVVPHGHSIDEPSPSAFHPAADLTSWHSAESIGEHDLDAPLLHDDSRGMLRFSFQRRVWTPNSADLGCGVLPLHDSQLQFFSRPGRSDGRNEEDLAEPRRARTTPTTPLHVVHDDHAAPMPCGNGPLWDPNNENHLPWGEALRGMPGSGGSLIIDLIKQLRPGQSLWAVELPYNILEPRSLLERLADTFVHSELLQPCSAASPAQLQGGVAEPLRSMLSTSNPFWKLVLLLRWYVSFFHMRPDGAKKPCNPILGEVFRCVFNPGSPLNQLDFVAEQICHHPPVSAWYAEGCGVQARGTYYPRSKLVSPNCGAAIATGSIMLNIQATKERFSLEWPSAFASGILVGSPRLELGGAVKITDLSTGAKVHLEFVRKSWFGGDYDRVEGCIIDARGQRTQHRFDGIWHGKVLYNDGNRSCVLFDAQRMPTPRPVALDAMGHPKQSRCVWQHVARNLRSQNGAAAAAAKRAVEEEQRRERRLLADQKREHETVLFKWLGDTSRPLSECKDIDDVNKWTFVATVLVPSSSPPTK